MCDFEGFRVLIFEAPRWLLLLDTSTLGIVKNFEVKFLQFHPDFNTLRISRYIVYMNNNHNICK